MQKTSASTSARQSSQRCWDYSLFVCFVFFVVSFVCLGKSIHAKVYRLLTYVCQSTFCSTFCHPRKGVKIICFLFGVPLNLFNHLIFCFPGLGFESDNFFFAPQSYQPIFHPIFHPDQGVQINCICFLNTWNQIHFTPGLDVGGELPARLWHIVAIVSQVSPCQI